MRVMCAEKYFSHKFCRKVNDVARMCERKQRCFPFRVQDRQWLLHYFNESVMCN